MWAISEKVYPKQGNESRASVPICQSSLKTVALERGEGSLGLRRGLFSIKGGGGIERELFCRNKKI